jgi:outer membrane lipoprotein-sorting protein
MKKSFLIIVTLISLISFSGMTQEMNQDVILDKYYHAIGIANIKEWKTLTMTGKSTAQGMEFPVTIYMKRPDKIRVEVVIQGNKMIQVFDGQAGWSVVPWSGSSDPQEMTADEIKGMKEQADFEGALYDWKEKGHKLELLGKEDMEGSRVFVIKVTRADENVETYYIDDEEFVPIKIKSITKIQGNETESEAIPSNYKEVNGAMMPFAIENKFKGQTVSNVVIDKYEINIDVDDNLFVKPVKKQ